MLVEPDNLVSAEEFRQHLDKYLAAAQEGRGPVAITRDSEVVGFFVSRDEYEAMFGVRVKRLLASRAQGRTISHAQARKRIHTSIQRTSGKP